MAEEGLHLDVCSGNELALALAAASRRSGRAARKQQVPGRTRLAVDGGIGHIVLDSFDEIERLGPGRRSGRGRGPPVPVLIRATVGIEAHTHEFIATAHEDQKFGFSLATGDAVTAAVRAFEPG